ncbi:alpha/beta fold hydrolase [Alteromonas mediterranea]|uniref:alpha/beta fold hydrolase n=1 Tax=Alteromonas mediterranea TaxID=314275 RepID=UPI0012FC2EA6|nr:alpha/beta hydrolase [Alteromonas mediterranea]QGX62962.1 alpha/beta fold hydrolase [Alteromonas mediterranea]
MLKNVKVLLIHSMLSLLLFSHVSLALGTDANSLARPAFDKRLSTVEYPFDVKMFSFSSQGIDLEMAYMFLPPKKDKPVVTLFHGKNFNGSYWESTARLLQSQGYGVLIPDQIGFGKSSKPTQYQYSFATLANNTRQLMQSLKIEKSIIVGHSMGGMLAARFALLSPDKSENLILINPIGLENYLLYESYTDIETVYQSELKKTPEMIVNYQTKNYYDGAWNNTYAEHAKFLQGWINGPDWETLARVNALTYDMIFTQPVIEEFDDLALPTTLILGTRDRTAPGRANKHDDVNRELGRYDKLGNEVKSRNSNIHVVELEGLGHLPHIEAFERFKVPFLDALHD